MLSLEEKIGQMLMVGFHGLEPPAYILDLLSQGKIGGIILFERNIQSPEQVTKLTSACHDAAKHPILIAIDQEGGTVARLREGSGFSESPGAMALSVSDSEDVAEEVSRVLASELRTLGINWNLAPVLDLTHNKENPSVGMRSAGTDKKRVNKIIAAQIRGYQGESVAATAKHFPGLGNTPIDTHYDLPTIDSTLDDLWAYDLVPFRVAIKDRVAAVMTSHVIFSQIDPDNPVTLSSTFINDILRDEIGFEGVATTDCMEMKAISDRYTPGESAILAILAGQDIVLFSHSFNPDSDVYGSIYDDMLSAVESGRITEERIDESIKRIARMKARFTLTQKPSTKGLRTTDSIEIMEDAARRGMILVKDESNLLPLDTMNKQIALIEFGSYLETIAIEDGNATGFAMLLHAHLPNVPALALTGDPSDEMREHAREIAANADIMLLATRSANVIPTQAELAQDIINHANDVILLPLRNAYDADIFDGVGTILCTCGDSAPSLRAAIAALLGHFTPSGKLPVNLA